MNILEAFMEMHEIISLSGWKFIYNNNTKNHKTAP